MTSETLSPIRYTDRFAWFWYNDEEIFSDTQADIDAKMKALHDQGITHVITFSFTHFRWSFRPWWPLINECLKRVCIAAHRFGIQVVEHHSSHLDSFLEEGEHTSDGFAREFTLRHGVIEHFDGLLDFLRRHDPVEAARWQINGQLGKPVTPYNAHAHCFNNEDYVRDYLAYLETVYATGVDGIMTDDVQYFGLGMACSCPTCRALFRKQTGLELPPDGDEEGWAKWTGNIRNPGFGAWMRFRHESVLNFHRRVAEHYHRLGLNLLRPNYTSGALGGNNLTAYAVDDLPELHVIFQECCYSSIIRYGFISYLDEQQHRAALGRKRNIPHMMMFYADDDNHLHFAWGVARLAGAMFTNTPEGGNAPDETRLRQFEIQYGENLFGLEPAAQVGFFDSRDNCDFGPCRSISRMRLWMQACRFANIQHVIVDSKHPETWTMPVICINEVGMLTDSEIGDLNRWMEQGGTLIVSGQCGVLDENMKERPLSEREWLETASLEADEIRIESRGKGRLVRVGHGFGYPGDSEETKALFIDNPDRFDFRANLRYHARAKHIVDSIDDRKNPSAARPGERYRCGIEARAAVALLLGELLGQAPVRIEGLPEGVLYSVFRTKEGGYAVHLLNACGCYDIAPDAVPSHADPVPFPTLSGKATLHVPGLDGFSARWMTLEGEQTLPAAEIDLSLLKEYALLLLTPKA